MDLPRIAIEAKDVSVGYGRTPILTNVNLRIGAGEFWFFLGPNGEGKTTLVKALLGVLRPQRGSVVRDPDIAGPGRIGFVPQRCDLTPSLPTTVREFVILGLSGMSVERAEESRRLSWALERVDLAGMEDRDYWSLSGGQRQRTLLARALVRRPGMLFLDEPTNGLDPSAEEALMQSLDRLRSEEKMTQIFVTHVIRLAAHHGTHVALFHNRGVTAGPREELLTESALARIFKTSVPLLS